MVAAVFAQWTMDFHAYNLGVYLRELFVMDMLGFAFLLVLSFLVQALVPNMFLGFFITIIFIIVNSFVWGVADIGSNMVKFAGTPRLCAVRFLRLPTLPEGTVLVPCVLAAVLRPAGRSGRPVLAARQGVFLEKTPANRPARMAGIPGFGLGALALWLGTAGWTFYNTKVENHYVTGRTQEAHNGGF
jgi:hypothetical protein